MDECHNRLNKESHTLKTIYRFESVYSSKVGKINSMFYVRTIVKRHKEAFLGISNVSVSYLDIIYTGLCMKIHEPIHLQLVLTLCICQ